MLPGFGSAEHEASSIPGNHSTTLLPSQSDVRSRLGRPEEPRTCCRPESAVLARDASRAVPLLKRQSIRAHRALVLKSLGWALLAAEDTLRQRWRSRGRLRIGRWSRTRRESRSRSLDRRVLLRSGAEAQYTERWRNDDKLKEKSRASRVLHRQRMEIEGKKDKAIEPTRNRGTGSCLTPLHSFWSSTDWAS